jgi:hemerythrin-like domain-containing protein
MCEYCGCQSITVIAELTREHDAVVAELAKLRHRLGEADLDAAAQTARRLTRILGPHTQVEEQGLFPLMVEDFPDHISALRGDHRLIEDVLGEASLATPTDAAWPARMLDVVELLREHILKEQDGVFPATLSVIDTEGWQSVEAARARAGTGLTTMVGAGRPAPQEAE